MTLPVFYYAQGTSYGLNFQVAGNNLFTLLPNGDMNTWVKGLNGQFHFWDTFPNDPFPLLLDTKLWQVKRVPYPASGIFIGPSIEVGVDWIIADILSLPAGTPFALGGYSQGAAVMSRIYNECRSGRLIQFRNNLKTVVAFGNPMRQVGHTFPGSSGYSGACDIPDSRSGGHGTFPSLDSLSVVDPFIRRFARLQNTEDLFWDFTMPNEVISGVGGSNDGNFLVNATKEGLRVIPVFAAFSLGQMQALWGRFGSGDIAGLVQDVAGLIGLTDPKLGSTSYRTGGGHMLYPWFPPPNADGSIPASGDTCYQIAAKHLNSIGQTVFNQMNPTVPTPTVKPSYQWFSSLPGG